MKWCITLSQDDKFVDQIYVAADNLYQARAKADRVFAYRNETGRMVARIVDDSKDEYREAAADEVNL